MQIVATWAALCDEVVDSHPTMITESHKRRIESKTKFNLAQPFGVWRVVCWARVFRLAGHGLTFGTG